MPPCSPWPCPVHYWWARRHAVGRAARDRAHGEENSMSNVDPATYRPLQDGLRAAGHFLDTNDRRLTSLLVVADGIVLTVMPHDLRGVDEALLLTQDDLRALWDQACGARAGGSELQT